MSGVVSPVVTWSSAVVTPSVPMLADGCPAIRQSWRQQLDVRGLAVGPGHRDHGLREGREEFRREPRERPARLGGRRYGPRHRASPPGRDTTATAPEATASGMKSSPLNARAAEGAEHGAGRDLAMVDGEAGDARPFRRCRSAPPRFISAPGVAAAGGISSEVSMSRLSSGMTPSSGPMREITRETTGAAVKAAVVTKLLASVGPGRVHHDDHHIARRVHRESRREGGNVELTIISAGRCAFSPVPVLPPTRKPAASARRPVPCWTLSRSNWRIR